MAALHIVKNGAGAGLVSRGQPRTPTTTARHIRLSRPAVASASSRARPGIQAPDAAGIPKDVALELQRAGVDVLSGSTPPLNAARYAMERKSTLLVVGLSVHRTPVNLREKLSVPEPEISRAIAELCQYPHIMEAGVLSTCNRMEVYVVARSSHPAVREIEDWMSRSSGLPVNELQESLFIARDDDAVDHLMTVAAGLDSLVVGEGQILSQVRQLHNIGQDIKGFGRILNALFKAAVTTGKRVRAETSISEGAVSISGAAAELADLKLRGGDEATQSSAALQGSQVAVVGAGKMSRLLVKHLHAKGVRSLTLVNRSLDRAELFAAEFPEVDLNVVGMEGLHGVLESADVAFFASASPDLLVKKADAEAMAANRATEAKRECMFVDIAVPRNVDSAINEVPGFACYNVDDLKQVVDANQSSRSSAALAARTIINAESKAFGTWKQGLESIPKIKALRDHADNIVGKELEKSLGKLDNKGQGLTPEQREAVLKLTHGVVNKLLHDPIASMRAAAAGHVGNSTSTPESHYWLN